MKTTTAMKKGPSEKARRAQLEQSIRHGGGAFTDLRELLTKLVRNPLGSARDEAAKLLGLKHVDEDGDRETFKVFRRLAKKEFEQEGTIEFDDDCPVSYTPEHGAYVQAWVHVDRPVLIESTEENLPPGQARCACGPCFVIVTGKPAEQLCGNCKAAGCELEGEDCKQ